MSDHDTANDLQKILIGLTAAVDLLHKENRAAGWWTDPKTGQDYSLDLFHFIVPTKLCLIHSEISEAMEGFRKGLYDDKLPDRPMIEVELADAFIRICDLAGALNLDLAGAVLAKREYNRNRLDHKLEARVASGGKAF